MRPPPIIAEIRVRAEYHRLFAMGLKDSGDHENGAVHLKSADLLDRAARTIEVIYQNAPCDKIVPTRFNEWPCGLRDGKDHETAKECHRYRLPHWLAVIFEDPEKAAKEPWEVKP